jgi:hypothetical protein
VGPSRYVALFLRLFDIMFVTPESKFSWKFYFLNFGHIFVTRPGYSWVLFVAAIMGLVLSHLANISECVGGTGGCRLYGDSVDSLDSVESL